MMLLRVEMPDQPGALGKVATAIASAGADIVSIRIVGRSEQQRVVDDFVIDLPPGALPDTLVSALDAETGAKVIWISRCPSQWNVLSEAELVSEMALDTAHAREMLFEHGPTLFHCQWAALARLDDPALLIATEDAPPLTAAQLAALAPLDQLHAVDLPADWAPGWGEVVAAVVPNGNGFVAILGRQGGPDFLGSELSRLQRVVSLLPSAPVVQ